MKNFISLFVILIALSCQNNQSREKEYQLVWSDEFDQDGPVSSDNWNIETVPPDNGSWYNGELQYYTDREDVSEKLLDAHSNLLCCRYYAFYFTNFLKQPQNDNETHV